MFSSRHINVGEKLHDKRIKLGMSLEELAELVDLSPGYLGLIERGQRNGTTNTLWKIVNALHMTTDDFNNDTVSQIKSPIKEKINIYINFLSDDDCEYILNTCKFIMLKNKKGLLLDYT